MEVPVIFIIFLFLRNCLKVTKHHIDSLILQYLQLQNALDNLEREKQTTAKVRNEANVYLSANLLLVIFD